ncbi:hypothetical protein [Gordonia sp. (in: high G+C Gram-positive bacteria)]|uniref:hypothetical protein n=1 Tax=Gordonia sp. (in: high G+C Gram-positive bacteria) TaxID=84139 RepID=UPI0016AF6F4A|nr:hypothetical protein [Gordonia sp. (in: high G+C Gram-positive bacteria)]NLG48361.1 hypothetical protein [Gordonia sp. (in: high G+C Gram-positive bacteria)]
MSAATVTELAPSETFWTRRPVLEHLRDFARSRRAGPWAVLCAALARADATLGPNVMLPPTIGSSVSTNLFVALVGPSGGGKGAAEGAARDAVRFVDHNGRPIEIEEFPLGSGEGISRTFRPQGTDDEEANPRTRALFIAPEVDTLSALGSRQGSTLMPELRKLYMGETIGFNNANKSTRSTLPAHSYRACLMVGVQPAKAGPLLYDSDGGTPQRFVWMPVGDPDAPDVAPSTPEPLVIKAPRWGTETQFLEVPDVAREAMDRHRLATLRGEDVDPLDGHRMLTRLKVAAALTVLDGRSITDEEDWELAGLIMRVSDRTRAHIERTLTEKARAANRARAQADSERAVIVDDARQAAEVRRVREGVIRYLTRRGRSARGDVLRSLKSDIRPHLDTVIDTLSEESLIVTTFVSDRPFYELAST